MNEEELNKIIKDINEKITENNIRVPEYDELNRMAKVNQFSYKFPTSLVFGMFGYAPLMLISSLTNVFPITAVPFIIIGGGITTGILGNFILEKIYKPKERLRDLSDAETESELLYEEIKNEIELEKVKNRNAILNDALTLIKSNYNTLSSMREKYEIQSKNIPESIEEVDKRIKKLEERLEELLSKLDDYSTRKILKDRFWKLDKKGTSIMDIISYSLVAGVISMLVLDMPFILVKDIMPMTIIQLFTPFIVGVLGTSAYNLKRETDSRTIQKQIKENLQIEDNNQNNENRSIDDLGMDIIVTISNLEEQKMYRDRLLGEQGQVDKVEEKETTHEHIQELQETAQVQTEEKDKPKQYVYKKK